MVGKRFILAIALVFLGMLVHAQPSPRVYYRCGGTYSLKKNSTLAVNDPSLSAIKVYSEKYFASKGNGDIVFSLDDGISPRPESFHLDITPEGIHIKAKDYAGAFYGLQQLLRLMPPSVYNGKASLKYPVELPCCHIEDYPEFPYRAVMLDVARVWVPMGSLYRLVDNIAYQNLNVLHLHLTDDEAWRVEIKSHPQLASRGGFRGPGCEIPAVFGKYNEIFGGFYSQEELKALVSYAEKRNITIVPEVDMPGHNRALGAVMPEILCKWQPDTSKTAGFDYRGVWCVSSEDNYKLIDDILTEICEVFPSPYIHIGGDEVGMNNWLECPDCKSLMKKLGVEDVHSLEDYFMRRVTDMVVSKGRTPLAWWDEDVIKDNLPESSVVYGWQNYESCLRAAQKGHKTVLAPAHFCYFDMHQSEKEHADTWGGVVDYEKVLSLSGMISSMDSLQRSNVIGVCGALWGETCTSHEPETSTYQDFMLFPRVSALARVSWNPQSVPLTAASTYEQLKAMNIEYRLPMPVLSYKNGEVTAEAGEGVDIFYMLNGVKERYIRPIRTTRPWLYSFISSSGSGKSEKAVYYGKRMMPGMKITSSIEENASKPLGVAASYSGVSYTGRCPKAGDWILYEFDSPVQCSLIIVKTGYAEFPSAVIASGDLYASYDSQTFEKVGRLDNGQASFMPSAPVKALRLISDRHGNGHYMVVVQPLEIFE